MSLNSRTRFCFLAAVPLLRSLRRSSVFARVRTRSSRVIAPGYSDPRQNTYRPTKSFRGLCFGLSIIGCLNCAFGQDGEKPSVTKFEPTIKADQMKPHVEFLASPKLSGRSGPVKAEARRYIIDHWKSAGLQPLFATDKDQPADNANKDAAFAQAIPGKADEDGTTPILGHNIGAWLPGSDPKLAEEIVIVSAHYDHLGMRDGQVFAGADDNASGVSMLIEVSRQIAALKVRPKRTMVFIGFDLEEHMLWGSRRFAAHPPWSLDRVKLFITADMIGRSLGDLPLPVVFVMGSERAPEVRAALDTVGTPVGLDVCRLGTDMVGTRSDYGPFRDREIPFLFFSTGEHPDYHTPRDTPDKIDYEKAARIASLIFKLSSFVADAPKSPVWNTAEQLGLEEPKALLRITNLLLEADKQKPLTTTQRFLVTNVRLRATKILEANTMSADDRTWLVRMSQALLATVF